MIVISKSKNRRKEDIQKKKRGKHYYEQAQLKKIYLKKN